MELPRTIKEELENKLKNLKLSKSEKEKIYRFVEKVYKKSLADVGEPVGLIATQSICEPATQMILRAFHFVGMAELQISLSLDRFAEIVDGRKKVKESYMIIRLKDKYKKDKNVAYKVAKKLREVKLKDVIDSIVTDLLNKRITLRFNDHFMKENDLSTEDISKVLKKKFKKIRVVECKKNEITLEFTGKSMREFYFYKDKVLDIQLRGIRGIKDVLVKKEDNEYVIYTYGSNLKEVMKIPEVDEKTVYSSNIYEVEKVLGIEAAREVIIREIVNILEKQGLDIDIRHILLLADVLTWYGKYMGVTRYGLPSEKSSALARAAFETPMKHFVKAAMLAEKDKLETAIENVMTNQPIPYGTGLFKVFYKEKEYKSQEKDTK